MCPSYESRAPHARRPDCEAKDTKPGSTPARGGCAATSKKTLVLSLHIRSGIRGKNPANIRHAPACLSPIHVRNHAPRPWGARNNRPANTAPGSRRASRLRAAQPRLWQRDRNPATLSGWRRSLRPWQLIRHSLLLKQGFSALLCNLNIPASTKSPAIRGQSRSTNAH